MPAEAGIQGREEMDTGVRLMTEASYQSVAQILPALVFSWYFLRRRKEHEGSHNPSATAPRSRIEVV
jgi:hypothetical protein